MFVLALVLGALAQAPAPCNEYAPDNFEIAFSTTKGNFTVVVDRDWASNSADRFWSALHCGHYTGDEFFYFEATTSKYVRWGLSGNTTDDNLWVNATFASDMPTQTNDNGFVSFYQDGLNTGSTQLIINLAPNPELDAALFAPFGQISSTDMAVVNKLYSAYGTQPDPNLVLADGNSYLKQNFPLLDSTFGVFPTVHCTTKVAYCNFDTTDPFAVQCCSGGENCIMGVGCRCLSDSC